MTRALCRYSDYVWPIIDPAEVDPEAPEPISWSNQPQLNTTVIYIADSNNNRIRRVTAEVCDDPTCAGRGRLMLLIHMLLLQTSECTDLR